MRREARCRLEQACKLKCRIATAGGDSLQAQIGAGLGMNELEDRAQLFWKELSERLLVAGLGEVLGRRSRAGCSRNPAASVSA
jgi:hypothetical protein